MNNLKLGKLRSDLESILKSCPIETDSGESSSELNPPITESELIEFEAKHEITLPSDYREFLLSIANGCIGPVGGIEKLGQFGGCDWENSDTIGIGKLNRRFPYSDSWNSKPLDDSFSNDEQQQRYLWYFGESHVDGAIPICDLGCGLRQLMIVSGPERGTIWFDDRVDWMGLYPESSHSQARVSFIEWYQDWVNNKLSELQL